jgi:hypothetical protein
MLRRREKRLGLARPTKNAASAAFFVEGVSVNHRRISGGNWVILPNQR